MSEYTLRPDDKVRATLGESVVVGRVVALAPGLWADIVPEGAAGERRHMTLFLEHGWQFEQIVEIPTKFGAVIRRADGRLFALVRPGDPAYSWRAGDRWVDPKTPVAGGFTVLFDGVDE